MMPLPFLAEFEFFSTFFNSKFIAWIINSGAGMISWWEPNCLAISESSISRLGGVLGRWPGARTCCIAFIKALVESFSLGKVILGAGMCSDLGRLNNGSVSKASKNKGSANERAFFRIGGWCFTAFWRVFWWRYFENGLSISKLEAEYAIFYEEVSWHLSEDRLIQKHQLLNVRLIEEERHFEQELLGKDRNRHLLISIDFKRSRKRMDRQLALKLISHW